MNGWLYSAHDLCRTRLCQAAGCESDAEPGWGLCARCERRRKREGRIRLHEVEQPHQPDPATELICPTCSTWKPDEAFAMQNDQRERRQRRYECRECSTIRRRAYRASIPPEKLAAQKARESARKRENARERREAKHLATLTAEARVAAIVALKAATRGIRT